MRDEDKTKEQLIEELLKLRQQNEHNFAEKLRKSEQKFKDFIMSANEGCILFDSELNFEEINDKGLEIFSHGVTRESLI